MNIFVQVDRKTAGLALEKLERFLSDAWLAFFLETEVEQYIKSRAKRRFDSEGDDVSGPWAPLAPATREFRRAEGFDPDAPINVRSRELINWVTQSEGRVAPVGVGVRLTYPGNQPTGELKKKVQTAQSGSTRNRGMRPTPPRPVLGVNATDLMFVMTRLKFGFEAM